MPTFHVENFDNIFENTSKNILMIIYFYHIFFVLIKITIVLQKKILE